MIMLQVLCFIMDGPNGCDSYLAGSAFADYLRDPNVLGFFSDNEINFSSNSSRILDRFLAINSSNDPAYVAAKSLWIPRACKV